MAGKTLPGIGDDESGEHDAFDQSDSGLRTPSAAGSDLSGPRSTDRMPLSLPVASGFSGPTVVDEDKVAEGLKKLRSLDEPLGPMPTSVIPPSSMPVSATPVSSMAASSMPTLKEGMPVVGAAPAPVTPAVAAAELLRSRGTAHGHALSGPGGSSILLPVSVDDRMKGTLLGHTLHLPDLPEPAEEKTRPAEVRSVAMPQQVPPAGALRPSEMVADFSNGDSRFFESEPVNGELDDLERPRPNMMFRGVVFFAVISVFGVAAFAWVNARKGDESTQVAQPEAEPAPTPPPAAPAAVAEPAPAAPAAAVAAPAEGVAVAPPAAAPTPPPAAVEPAPAPQPPTTKVIKRELAAVDQTKTSSRTTSQNTSTSTRSSRHTDSTRDVPPPAAKPTPTPTPTAKRGKTVEDPDGTLPLSD